MKTAELFKQFIFGTVFFVTCVSLHLNYVSSNDKEELVSHQVQQITNPVNVLAINHFEQRLAISNSAKTVKL